MGNTIKPISPVLVPNASTLETPPLQQRGYNPRNGLPITPTRITAPSPRGEKPGFGGSVPRAPVVSATQKPGVNPPRARNDGVEAPFNPQTNIFSEEKTSVGAKRPSALTTRYDNGGTLTGQRRDRGTQAIDPSPTVNPTRVDFLTPWVKGRKDTNLLESNVELEANPGPQNSRFSLNTHMPLGNSGNAMLGVTAASPLQNVGKGSATQVQIDAGLGWDVSDKLTVGVGAYTDTGGGKKDSTTVNPSVGVTTGDVKITGGPTATVEGGNVRWGGAINVEPKEPSNTTPQGSGSLKLNVDQDGQPTLTILGGTTFK